MTRHRTIAVPTITGALVVLIIVASVALGRFTQESDVPTPAGPAIAQSDKIRAYASLVFESFYGTVPQRDAAGVVGAWLDNGAMDTCMDQAGYPEWDWSITRQYASSVDPLSSSAFFDDPAGKALSSTLMATVPGIIADDRLMNLTPGPVEDEVISRCLETTPPPSDEQGQLRPVGRGLLEDWRALMYSLDAEFGDEDAFWRCVDDANPSVLDGVEEPGEGGSVLYSLAPDGDDTPTGLSDPKADDDAWQRFLVAEQEWDAARWGCRSQVYNEHIDDVNTAVHQFALDNAKRIASTKAEWLVVEKRAAELGYHGQVGSIENQVP